MNAPISGTLRRSAFKGTGNGMFSRSLRIATIGAVRRTGCEKLRDLPDSQEGGGYQTTLGGSRNVVSGGNGKEEPIGRPPHADLPRLPGSIPPLPSFPLSGISGPRDNLSSRFFDSFKSVSPSGSSISGFQGRDVPADFREGDTEDESPGRQECCGPGIRESPPTLFREPVLFPEKP